MSLTDLPIELVNSTCSYLELPDWAALRLSCRSLYTKSLDAFANRSFRSICFIATGEGMRQLEELAKSGLRNGVQQLWMVPTVFEGFHDMDLRKFRDSRYSKPLPRRRQNDDMLYARYAVYQSIVADHLALVKSSTFSDRLHACFASFRNLESVGLKHYATSFLLDPRQTGIRFLGFQNLRDKASYELHTSNLNLLQWHYGANANSLALSRLLQGLNESNQKIRELHTCGANFCGSISPDSFLKEKQFDSLLPKLSALENLHICICHQKRKANYPASPHSYIDLLTVVAPSLKKLEFSQWYQNSRDMSQSHFSELSQSIKFARLKDLRLYWIQIEHDSFKSFLITAKGTLNSLSLELVTLKTDTPPIIHPEPTSWKQIWEFLGEDLSLKSFYMGNLGYWGRKLMIQGPDDSIKPTYFARFDAKLATSSFKDWIRNLKPILSESGDLSERKYPDSSNVPSADASAYGSGENERCPQPFGLGSENAEPEVFFNLE